MKIIDIGICIDNRDPRGLGRIRTVRFSDYVSEKEKADTYEPFSDKDIFVAIPFLPTNINFIPEIDQAVKIINYNTEKENVNVEYIAGPFTTTHNFNDQSFSPQTSETTYGNSFKNKPDIFNSKEDFRKKKSIGSLAKKTDYGIYGKYGSDIIFTENGLQLRGGKLLSKEKANAKDRDDIYVYPLMTEKSSVLNLKKFPHKLEYIDEETIINTTEIKDINHIIEYNLVDDSGNTTISNPYAVRFYVYKVLRAYGDISKTNNFNENSQIPSSLLQLINLEGDSSSPTHEIILNTTGFTDIACEIRDFLLTIHEDDLKKINSLYPKTGLHPFFFRPKESLVTMTGNTTSITYKKNILSAIELYKVGPGSGLSFSSANIKPIVTPNPVTRKVIRVVPKSNEQSFSSLRSDKIYLLSTDTNNTEKIIPFEKLDKYELTQTDYVEQIDPNTYALVRGENLIRLLTSFIQVFKTHQHNVVDTYVTTGNSLSDEFEKLVSTMQNDLLNGSIRIN
jgi:hypothetical protein